MANKANTEFETKVIDFNVDEIIQKLRDLGADETPEMLLKRYVFDMESKDIEWIRLRAVGDKTFLAYKKKIRGNVTLGKTEEIEVEVSDFDRTAELMKKISFKRIFYQENRRHLFVLDQVEYAIDLWPLIPPYLEIEAESEERVNQALKALGLEDKSVGDRDVTEIYADHGYDIHTYKELKFPTE